MNITIRQVLADHPEYNSIEQVREECQRRGVPAGIWQIVFAARSANRELNRDEENPNPADSIRDVAQGLIELHGSVGDAINTLRSVSVQLLNDNRMQWEIDMEAPARVWQASVAQELLDLCEGDVNRAIDTVRTL